MYLPKNKNSTSIRFWPHLCNVLKPLSLLNTLLGSFQNEISSSVGFQFHANVSVTKSELRTRKLFFDYGILPRRSNHFAGVCSWDVFPSLLLLLTHSLALAWSRGYQAPSLLCAMSLCYLALVQ